MRQMQQQLIDVAAEEGLASGSSDTVHTNTVDAHRLLHLALETGGAALQRELKEALLSAYFDRAPTTSATTTCSARPPSTSASTRPASDEVLASDEYADAVAADIAQARAYGATGVPFFVVDQKYGVSGAQPAEVFSQVLDQAWAASHPVLRWSAATPTPAARTAAPCDAIRETGRR